MSLNDVHLGFSQQKKTKQKNGLFISILFLKKSFSTKILSNTSIFYIYNDMFPEHQIGAVSQLQFLFSQTNDIIC